MYAVIFMSDVSDVQDGYAEMSETMVTLAQQQPGFIRVESWRNPDGTGCTVSWWDSQEAIAAWKANAKHLIAQKIGAERWYKSFETQVAHVERVHKST